MIAYSDNDKYSFRTSHLYKPKQSFIQRVETYAKGVTKKGGRVKKNQILVWLLPRDVGGKVTYFPTPSTMVGRRSPSRAGLKGINPHYSPVLCHYLRGITVAPSLSADVFAGTRTFYTYYIARCGGGFFMYVFFTLLAARSFRIVRRRIDI